MTDKSKLTFRNPKTRITAGKNTNATKTGNANSAGSSPNEQTTQVHSGRGHQYTQPTLTDREYQAILSYMQYSYPKAFPNNSTPLPLAVGIHKQLLASEEGIW